MSAYMHCPYCKEEIYGDALKCKHCKAILYTYTGISKINLQISFVSIVVIAYFMIVYDPSVNGSKVLDHDSVTVQHRAIFAGICGLIYGLWGIYIHHLRLKHGEYIDKSQ